MLFFAMLGAWQGNGNVKKTQWHLLSPSLQQLKGSGSTAAIVGGLTSAGAGARPSAAFRNGQLEKHHFPEKME